MFFSKVNQATARVLAAEGCEVVSPPEQGCCGALMIHTGREGQALELARATIDVFERQGLPTGTIITAEQLKSFVRRELRADRRKGFVRNIGSRSGLEQFTWLLSRCTPVPYATPAENPNPVVTKLLTASAQERARRG